MRSLFAVFALMLASLSASAQETAVRSFPIDSKNALELKVPTSWKVSTGPSQNGLPPTIKFTPSAGPQFEILITASLPDASTRNPSASMNELRSLVREAANSAASQAVEKPIELKELRGANGGYYFSATDRAPKPGEYKFLNQGMLGAGQLRVAFTILTNDGQEAIVKQGIAMVLDSAHR